MYEKTKLTRYPIPNFPLPSGNNQYLLDLGCNWGRWCISAAQNGYIPVGLDPNFEAILAAKRVSEQLGLSINYVVGDARYLPFLPNTFDVVFSYSVLQHFAKSDVKLVIAEISQILKPQGYSFIEMLNTYGLRSFYHLAKRRFRKPVDFEVRYWSPSELLTNFGIIGETSLSVDGFFSANAQVSDKDILSSPFQLVVNISSNLRSLSEKLPGIKYVADSLYVKSIKTSS